MRLKLLKPHFSICKVPDLGAVNWNVPFCFAARTDEECSLVCPREYVPECALERDDGWRALRIEGVLDFSLVGILARIASVLAEEQIPVFVVSTYNTDYVLVKKELLFEATAALTGHGYQIMEP